MKNLFCLLGFAVLAGCATTAIPTDQSIQATDIADKTMTAPREGAAARLIIKRDPGFVGSACAIRVSVSRKPLANLRPGEIVTAYLDVGEYIVGATSTGICGGGDAEAPLLLRAGEVRTFRVSIDQGMSIRIGPTAH